MASFQMGRYREAKNSFLEGQKLGGGFLKMCSVMLFVSSKNRDFVWLCYPKTASDTCIFSKSVKTKCRGGGGGVLIQSISWIWTDL